MTQSDTFVQHTPALTADADRRHDGVAVQKCLIEVGCGEQAQPTPAYNFLAQRSDGTQAVSVHIHKPEFLKIEGCGISKRAAREFWRAYTAATYQSQPQEINLSLLPNCTALRRVYHVIAARFGEKRQLSLYFDIC
jgi:hypothetical protein